MGDERRDPTQKERRSDRGTVGKAQAFLSENPDVFKLIKRAVVSVLLWLLLISAGVTIAILKQRSDESKTRTQARVACERSLMFGPPIADFYSHARVLSPAMVELYRLTIPKEC